MTAEQTPLWITGSAGVSMEIGQGFIFAKSLLLSSHISQ
jgi:hypothetical protein